jgi:Domain of unknown function DUF29
MSMTSLYERDFFHWAQEQTALLRRAASLRLNAPPGLDWEHIAEEIEQLGKDKLDELNARYVVLVAHLLKWRYQAKMRCGSWRGSVNEQRYRIARVLRRNPSIRPLREREFDEAYAEARQRALDETGLPDQLIPDACPFTLQEAEDRDYWPPAQGQEA